MRDFTTKTSESFIESFADEHELHNLVKEKDLF